MVAVPGSEILSGGLHVVAQSLFIPVIIGLLAFIAYSIITLGGLISEYSSRIKVDVKEIEDLIKAISGSKPEQIVEIVKNSGLPQSQKKILNDIALSSELGPDSMESLARKLIENEELRVEKSVEKTDMVTRLGPTLGLMGTLIPMGPGLAALGVGDVTTLAQSIIVAFDTTVAGLAAGGICYFISKIRRRWYEEYLSNLESVAESIVEVNKNASTSKTQTVW